MEYYQIKSENSSDHWPFFDVKNKNVLDIGCGIWYTKEMEETSPIYFAKEANLVVGIDANHGDIEKYKNYVGDNNKFVFQHLPIDNVQQVRNLITEHSITSLKSDIEGHEVILLDLTKEDLENVETIAIEFHSEELKEAFMKKIPEWGFEIKLVADFAATPPKLGVIYGSK